MNYTSHARPMAAMQGPYPLIKSRAARRDCMRLGIETNTQVNLGSLLQLLQKTTSYTYTYFSFFRKQLIIILAAGKNSVRMTCPILAYFTMTLLYVLVCPLRDEEAKLKLLSSKEPPKVYILHTHKTECIHGGRLYLRIWHKGILLQSVYSILIVH